MKLTGRLAILLMVATTTQAADEDSRYVVWGMGQDSCNSYNLARAGNQSDEYWNYVAGYLTAYNAFAPDTYDIAGGKNREAMLSWLDDHCADKQVGSISDAMHQFIEAHIETRLRTVPGEGARWP